MASDVAQSGQVQLGQLSGNVLLYSQPEPLSLETHGKLHMRRSERPYNFAATAHAVPVHVTEFGPAGLCYPLIFSGEDRLPLAVMSIRPNENLFVNADGSFAPEAYVPAFLRRYPFVLANNEQQQQMVVCIDRSATALTEEEEDGVPLFENGKPSEYTSQAMQFCSDFETERLRTEQFVKRVHELELLELKKATVTPRNPDGTAGPPVQLADYFGVSEEKLAKLPDDVVVELHRSGALRQIAIHLNSLLNWERLITKTIERFPTAGTA